jgi:D-psicose/D-tagatose/L-ribulose 3-epimerase
MKLGVSALVWADQIGHDNVGPIDAAHELGFDGIEIVDVNPDSFNVGAAEAALKRTGLTPIISGDQSETSDLVLSDPEAHRKGQALLRFWVDTAVRIGAEVIGGGICNAPGRLWLADAAQKQREFDRAVQNLRPAAAYAAEHGVRLAFEIINRYESSFLNTVEEGVRLVEAVDSPAFGLLLDTFHMHIEEKAIGAAIRRAGKHLFHFHAIENDRGTPGSGSIDWSGVVDALHEIDYQDWIVIEGFNTEVDWLAQAVSIWRPLADDMTQLAADGQTFLKGIIQARGAAGQR